MQQRRRDGFALSRLLLVLGGIILVGLGLFFVYLFISSDQEKKAAEYTNSFVKTINEQDAETGYGKLSPNLQSQLRTPMSWALWMREFKRAELSVAESPVSSQKVGGDIMNPSFMFGYDISNGVRLNITAVSTDTGWRIDKYEIVN